MASESQESVDVRLDALTEKIDEIQRSLDRMRRAAYIRLVLTIIIVVLPLIGLVATLPRMFTMLSNSDILGL
ncbi:MAG: hypothetical protein Q7T01_03075 [bacterium]|nr:hypothetical protein [bacterium]